MGRVGAGGAARAATPLLLLLLLLARPPPAAAGDSKKSGEPARAYGAIRGAGRGQGGGGGAGRGADCDSRGGTCALTWRGDVALFSLWVAPPAGRPGLRNPHARFSVPGPAEFAHLQCTYLLSRSLSPVLGVAIVAPKSWEVAELINKE